MRKALIILGAIAALCLIALTVMAVGFYDSWLFLENSIRTEPARRARWPKQPEPEPEKEITYVPPVGTAQPKKPESEKANSPIV